MRHPAELRTRGKVYAVAMTNDFNDSQVSLFDGLEPAEQQIIATAGKQISKAKDEVILLYDEQVLGIYQVLSGSVAIFPVNAKVALTTLTKGAVFGEMAFLEEGTASATVRATEDGVILMLIRHQDLTFILQQNPSIAAKVYRNLAVALSQRLRSTNDRVIQEMNDAARIFDNFKSEITRFEDEHRRQRAFFDLASSLTQQMTNTRDRLQKAARNPEEFKREYHAILNDINQMEQALQANSQYWKSQSATLMQWVDDLNDRLQGVKKILMK